MHHYTLVPVTSLNIAALTARIERDFAPHDRPPKEALIHDFNAGLYTAYELMEGDVSCAYAFCAQNEKSVLISFLAVEPKLRSNGCGTILLQLLAAEFASFDSLFVEVSPPKAAKDEKAKHTRERRIRFYRRAGFDVCRHTSVQLFDVPYLIMRYPISRTPVDVKSCLGGIYAKLLRDSYHTRLTFISA